MSRALAIVCVFTGLSLAFSNASGADSRTPSSRGGRSRDLQPRVEKPLPLGQLLIVGFKGTELKDGLDDVIRETKPGGILLFGRNVKSAEQVANLNFAAQALSKKVSNSPLLIAIDQEGGNVIRIRHTPTLPSALAISKTRDLTVARRSGNATGRLLKSLGINVNLAPVVDVSDPDTDLFLGTRSYGNDAHHVAAMTTSVALGLQEHGVLPIAKHFPGHGDASGDSHVMAATSPFDRDQLNTRDLIPYLSLEQNLKMPWGAMLAHVSFPAVDPSGDPATFSKPIINGVFRESISTTALVMTDDIEMAGANAEKDIGLRAVRAIEAGADMVMIAWSRRIQVEVLKSLRSAVDSGRLKRSRVEEALKRIEIARNAYVPKNIVRASRDELTRSLQNPEFKMIGNAVLRAAARNLEERRPASIDIGDLSQTNTTPARFKPSEDSIIVLSARTDFIQKFRARAKGHKVKSLFLRPSQRSSIERVLRANPESPVFVYLSGRQVARFIDKMDDELKARMILINVETRAAISDPGKFRDIFDIHYRHPELGRVVAESYLELTSSPAKRSAASQPPEPKR